MNPNDHVSFRKSVRIGDASDLDDSNANTHYGSLRYNINTNKFEGLHKSTGADIFGNVWRELGVDVASSDKIGGIRIGENLFINPDTGVLNAVGNSPSRMNQRIITISPFPGISDFHDIKTAISSTLGTSPDWNNGSLTQKYGAPADSNIYIFELTPGIFNSQSTVELPDFVHLLGYSKEATIINVSSLIIGDHNVIYNITVNGNLKSLYKDSINIHDSIINGELLIEAGQFHVLKSLEVYNTITLKQCQASMKFVNVKITRHHKHAIILDNCIPITLDDTIILEDITCSINSDIIADSAILCESSMFICRNSRIIGYKNGIVFKSATIINDYFTRSENHNVTELTTINQNKNLIRKGFIEKAMILISTSDNTHIKQIHSLDLLSLTLNDTLNTDDTTIPIRIEQFMFIDLYNVEFNVVYSSISCDKGSIYYIKARGIIQSMTSTINIGNGTNVLIMDNKREYIVGNSGRHHFTAISAAIDAIDGDLPFTIILEEGIIINLGKGEPLVCKEGLNIVGNNSELILEELVLKSHVKLENLQIKCKRAILDHVVDCYITNCKFICEEAFNINTSSFSMTNCKIKCDGDGDGDASSIKSGMMISSDGSVMENVIILRSVDIYMNFSKIPLVGGYAIDSSSFEEYEGHGDKIILIGCIFNRNIYLNKKIIQHIVNCVEI
jgi:hypothetical protein